VLCWSLATSVSSRKVWSFFRRIGAHWSSSSLSAAIRKIVVERARYQPARLGHFQTRTKRAKRSARLVRARGIFSIPGPHLCGAPGPRKNELISLLSNLDYNRSDNLELGRSEWACAVLVRDHERSTSRI
jgi:hypothetical protein